MPGGPEPAWHHAAVVYQVYLRSFADGEGLGLWEVEDIPDELIGDPIFLRSEHRIPRPRWLPGAAAVASERTWLRFRSSRGRRALAATAGGMAPPCRGRAG